MRAKVFLDSNVLLYFLSKAPAEESKTRVATDLLLRDDCGLSSQVISECYVNAVYKGSYRLPHAQVMAFLETLDRYPILPASFDLFRQAAELSHRRRISFWDAAIVAAAQILGCSVVFSEDLQHGQRFGAVKVVNPFATMEECR